MPLTPSALPGSLRQSLRALAAAAALALLLCLPPTAAASGRSVLVLHSYHPDLAWTAGIMTGMHRELDTVRPPLSLHVEYLDTKRNPGAAYRAEYLDGVLPHKLANHRFDLVLLSDNDAFDFVVAHRRDLFAGVPVVFCGVNGYTPAMLRGEHGITGVAEMPAFAETVDLALRLHPGTRRVIFVGETRTATGQISDETLQQIARRHAPAIATEFWNDLPSEELQKRIAGLGRENLVFLASVLRDRKGEVISYEESARLLRERSPVPIYGSWDFFLGEGIVGGKLTSSDAQGVTAAKLARRILAGENPDAIPVTTADGTRFMFDYRELRRFGIPLDRLPAESEVLFRPPTFYRLGKWQLWAGALLIVLLALVVSLLLFYLVTRRKAQLVLAERARLAALQAEVGRILTRGERLRPTLQACAEALVRQTDTLFGRIWTLAAEDPELLELQASAGLYTRIDGQHSRKRVGEFKVGLIAGKRQPYLTNQVVGNPDFSDQEWVRREGITSFAGYPLVVQDRLVGVAAFFGKTALNQAVIEAIGSVADMIAVGIEHIRANEAVKQALNEAEASRNRIDAILASVADGLVVSDPDGRVVLMNLAAEELLGLPLARAASLSLESILADKQAGEALCRLAACETDRASFELEIAAEGKNGSRAVQGHSAVVGSRTGEPLGTVTILRDISRERELDRMKNEFIATAAHELRTPLAAVLGYAELLLGEEAAAPFPPAQRREYLQYIFEKGERLEGIIDELLDLGRIESGRSIVLEKAPCEMIGLVKEVVAQHQQETSRHRFEAECPAECIRVEVDRGKMLRVFDNLLSNAVKYSPAGGTIRIGGGVREGWLEISIADEGIGMTPEQVGRVFDKFYRADTSDTAVQGLGLGLTLSKGIIEAHGGCIWVESEPGKGTRVTFRLPLPPAQPD